MNRSTRKRPAAPRLKNLSRTTLLAFVGSVPLYLLLFRLADRPAVGWARDRFAGTWVHDLGEAISLPGHSPAVEVLLAGALLVAAAAHLLPGGKERSWPADLFYVWVSAFAASLAGQGLKMLLGRGRPELLFADGRYGLSFFSTRWELTSTPSGHAILAFSVMTSLSLLIPRRRWIFLSLAVLVAASRVAVTDHYPSDVLFGALIGAFSALWFHRWFYPGPRQGETAGRLTPG